MQKEETNSSSLKKTSTQTNPQQRNSTRLRKESTGNSKNTKKSTNAKKSSGTVSEAACDKHQIKQTVSNPSMLDNCISFLKSGNANPFQQKSRGKSPQNSNTPGNKKKNSNKSYYTQDLLGIRQIIGGMVCMDNGTVIGIQEIIPLNFYQKTTSEKNDIYQTYMGLFKIAPKNMHLKMRTERANVQKTIANILRCNQHEQNQKVLRQMSDYIKHIQELQSKNSFCKRFYIIWEYEGDIDGKKSNDINEIYRDMEQTRAQINNIFDQMGHITVTPPDINYYVCELLYKFFNPKTNDTEPFYSRFNRIKTDESKYNTGLSDKARKHVYEEDFIAPKGVTVKPNYVIMDGIYHTYIALRDDGHPGLVLTGWTDLLCLGLGYDTDIFIHKLPYNVTLSAIEQSNRIGRVYSKKKINNPDKYEELQHSIANKKAITDHMKNRDEDLWECLIMVTIRGNSYQDMIIKKNNLVQFLRSKSIYTEDSFITAFRYFKMSFPLMNIDEALFNRNKRNYLTSSLASLYNYTSYELFDETGLVLGLNQKNNSLASIDNFNTTYFSNANILLLGATGSGKTFTEMMLARRMRLTGIRTFFVLPVKGHEYYDFVRAHGGEIVELFPGSDTCINFMELRPEAKINKNLLGEDILVENQSILAKKIVFIETLLQLLMQGDKFTVSESNRLNRIVTEIYGRFGITHDNDSLYRNKELDILKEMPIPQDLYDALERDDTLSRVCDVLIPFIEGSCQNFNGHTNVCLTNRCIVFDVNEDIIGEKLLPAFMYIAMDCLYDLVKQDMYSKDAIFLDETWKMLVNEECAKQVNKLVRLIRGYAGSVVIASQDIEEFLSQSNGFGNAVIANTEIKILLKMKPKQVDAVANCMELSYIDKKNLKKYKRGYGMIVANQDKVNVQFVATETEEALFTTDVNVKKRLSEKKVKEHRESRRRSSRSVKKI